MKLLSLNKYMMDMTMKQITEKILISSISLGLVFLCCTGAIASEYSAESRDKTVLCTQVTQLQAENSPIVDSFRLDSTRATNRVDITVGAGKLTKAATPFSLETGETVCMNFTYSPKSSSISAGLIDSNGYFYSVQGSFGTMNKTIRVRAYLKTKKCTKDCYVLY